MKLPNAVPKPKRSGRKPSPLKRSRMKRYNAKREGRMFAGRVDREFLAWLRTLPCALCASLGTTQVTPTEAEHFVQKSHGGYDRGDTYPTCGTHREMRHVLMGTKAFTKHLKARGFDERAACNHYAARYEAERWPCP